MNPADAVVTTEAGLVVPAHAADAMERIRDVLDPKGGAQGSVPIRRLPTAYDADGRRRVGLTKRERRDVEKMIRILNAQGIGVVLSCVQRFDGKTPCGGCLSPEGQGGPDDGFGCNCSRLHFLA